MPIRTFTQADIINIVEGFTSPIAGNISVNANHGVFGELSGSVTGSVSGEEDPAPGIGGSFTYKQEGNIDIDRFPRIPESALITQVVYKYSFSASVDCSANSDQVGVVTRSISGGSGTNSSQVGSGEATIGSHTGPVNFHETASNSGQIINIIDYSSNPITIDQLNTEVEISLGMFGDAACTSGIPAYTLSVSISGSGSQFLVEVTYFEQFSFDWHIENPSGPYSYAKGDIATIKGRENLDKVRDVIVSIDGNTENGITAQIIHQSDTEIQFLIPDLGGYSGPVFILVTPKPELESESSIFSGIVLIGTLEILYADASGIYTLTPGKKSDTLYLRDEDETTIDVPIPSPFIKTGFVGG